MNHGDVFWCDFPAPDRRRPVVILTRDWAIPVLTSLTVAPITSALRTGPAFVEVSMEDGLFEDSIVNCDALATVPKSDFGEFVTAMSEQKLLAVKQAIGFALDLDD